MILLFTDFSHLDPYVGQMHRAIRRIDSRVPVVDLFHAVPSFNHRAAAYLLPRYCPPVAGEIYCCVVDPGVGGERAALKVTCNGCHYLGPDNGLFELLLRAHTCKVERIDWRPEELSASFHGRDLFAPVAALIHQGKEFDTSPVEPSRFPGWPDDLKEIVYFDHYGNAITGCRASSVDRQAGLEIAGKTLKYSETFSKVPIGFAFWYENSNGLVEIAVNQGSAMAVLGLKLAQEFKAILP